MAGKLSVIGIGPGSFDMMTRQADYALEDADCIIGYHVYVDLVKEHYPDKPVLTTPMRKEEERCRIALDEAAKGQNVAFVCSGDAGVYGMAGLIYEIAAADEELYKAVEIEVIPGITAALSGAAMLGAPLIHDFCLISLSDLITPWETIAGRLRAAAEGDFGIVLYNPSSHKRADYLMRACDILLEILPPEQICGIAGNIGREGAFAKTCTLEELRDTKVDMFSTVFIGNSMTHLVGELMVTPRGYAYERELRG